MSDIIRSILGQTSHRPWSLPSKTWSFYQEWNQTIFLHWKVETAWLRSLIPEELEIDTHMGESYLSLVAFNMDRIRPKYLPAVGFVSDFFEVNVRTYVKYKDRAGVYFLSIEGSKKLACHIAKRISGLPYTYNPMERLTNQYSVGNNTSINKFSIEFEAIEMQNTKNATDLWLTERYALFQDVKGKIRGFDIHHEEWPIQQLIINKLEINYPQFNHIFEKKIDFCHYSPGVKVLAWT